MLRLKIDQLMFERNLNAKEVAQLSGIRYSTVLDMKSHQSKVWSHDHLDKLMKVFALSSIDQLIEYRADDSDQFMQIFEHQLEHLSATARNQLLTKLVEKYGLC